VFRECFAREGIQAEFIARRPARCSVLANPAGPALQLLAQSIEYNAACWLRERLAIAVNDRRIARRARGVDAVMLVKTDSAALMRRLRAHSRARLVYDLSDPVWQPQYRRYRAIDDILRSADAVTYDYEATRVYAQKLARAVFHWPPHSQVERFDPLRSDRPTRPDRLTIGWVGSPSTTFNLYRNWEALEAVFGRHANVHLRLLGAGYGRMPHYEKVVYSNVSCYTPRQMIEELLRVDIGIFPLFATENAKVHGFLKALVYMSGGAAVICSPVGDCATLIHDGQNGFLAGSTAEWIEKLDRLIVDHDARQRIAAAGLDTARAPEYSLEHAFQHVREALAV
jgi:glycosyltransferase involved in cell wall biosynthesis